MKKMCALLAILLSFGPFSSRTYGMSCAAYSVGTVDLNKPWEQYTWYPRQADSANSTFFLRSSPESAPVGFIKLYGKRVWVPSNLTEVAMFRPYEYLPKAGMPARNVFYARLAERFGIPTPKVTAFQSGEYAALFAEALNGYDTLQGRMNRRMSPLLPQISAAAAQIFLLLEFLVVSQDRSQNNWMVSEDGKWAVIDNDRIAPTRVSPPWFKKINIQGLLPQARGQVLDEVKALFQSLSESELKDMWRSAGFVDDGIRSVLHRWAIIQAELDKGTPLEDIYFQDVRSGYFAVSTKTTEIVFLKTGY